jgi:hypothetical protein
MIDAPGLLMEAVRNVTISPTNRVFTNQSYIVGANKIIISENPLPVTENPIVGGVRVRPNPTNGLFTTNFALNNGAYVTADLFNALGQRIMGVYSGQMLPGMQQIEGDISSLPNGVFYLRLVTNSTDVVVRKLVKTSAY